MGVLVGEGLNRAAGSARSAFRLVALMLIETAAMRCVQAPSRECGNPESIIWDDGQFESSGEAALPGDVEALW